MTLEFKDMLVTDLTPTASLTEARQAGFIPDPIWPHWSNERFQLIHLVKGTPEEIEEYRSKAQMKAPEIKTAFDVKMACLFYAKNVRQLDPRKDAFSLETILKEKPENGFIWVCTDKWKDLEEWSLLPPEIVEKIRLAINPKFDPVTLFKTLTKEEMHELLEATSKITDQLGQELIKKGAAEPQPQPSTPPPSPPV